MRRLLPSCSLVHVLAVVLSVSTIGCMDASVADFGGERDDPQNAEEDCFENGSGECVVTTVGCDPSSITGNAGEKCAVCEGEGDAVEICGTPDVASCYAIEFGDECTLCSDGDDNVVWTDCPNGNALVALDCEYVSYEPDVDSPEGRECEVCHDETGRVVTESCGLEAEECHVEVVDGRECEVCTADDMVVFRACGSPTLAEPPRLCEIYEDEEGRCVDCYSADDLLLSHECTFGAGALDVFDCELVVGPSGQQCERCYNEDGFLVDETCEGGGGVPSPERCTELVYEFTDEVITCFACVDEGGDFTVADCSSSLCNDDSFAPTCGEPVCQSFYQAGEPCRTCESSNGDSQTQCFPQSDIYCQAEEVFTELPPPDSDPNQPPGVDVQVCNVCRDTATNVEVSRNCDSSDPPVCVADSSLDGDACQTCFDSATGYVLYTTCEEPMCEELLDTPLTGPDGVPLTLPSTDPNAMEQSATATCSYCVANANTSPVEDYGTCVLLETECDEGGPCASAPRVLMAYDLTQCADPWGSSDDIEGMRRMMSWAIEAQGIVVHIVEHEFPGMAADACESCDCLRGDRFVAHVDEADADKLANLGFQPFNQPGVPPDPAP